MVKEEIGDSVEKEIDEVDGERRVSSVDRESMETVERSRPKEMETEKPVVRYRGDETENMDGIVEGKVLEKRERASQGERDGEDTERDVGLRVSIEVG